MRRNTAGGNSERVVSTADAPLGGGLIRRALFGNLLLIALLASPMAFAEPAALALIGELDSIEIVAKIETLRVEPQAISMDSLLEISGLSPYRFRSDAQIADELLAAAVERGTNADLAPVSAFRKRRSDLFRAERPVEIGDQEMLIRLRLRAKARKAMSVELHF